MGMCKVYRQASVDVTASLSAPTGRPALYAPAVGPLAPL